MVNDNINRMMVEWCVEMNEYLSSLLIKYIILNSGNKFFIGPFSWKIYEFFLNDYLVNSFLLKFWPQSEICKLLQKCYAII